MEYKKPRKPCINPYHSVWLVYEYLKNNERCNLKNIHDDTGVNNQAIKSIIDLLIKMKLAKQEKIKRRYYQWLIKNGE